MRTCFLTWTYKYERIYQDAIEEKNNTRIEQHQTEAANKSAEADRLTVKTTNIH